VFLNHSPWLVMCFLNSRIHIPYTVIWYTLSQPYFWKSVRMTLTLPKWGLGSPPGLPKLQSSIAGVKTPCIKVFFKWLENYWNVDVENGLAWAIWTSIIQVMAKKKAGNQIGNLTPDH
jgi:hypothetical protein